MESCIFFLGRRDQKQPWTALLLIKKFYPQREEWTIHQPNLLSIYFRVALVLSAAASSAPKHA
jgi:hypothetical protein